MSKIKDEDLTKIEVSNLISLDTIDNDKREITIKIKNVGKKDLKPIIRFHCSCITPPKYDSIINSGKEENIKMEFPIDKKGNFSYPIYVYGNFYPYIRTILVEGYRK